MTIIEQLDEVITSTGGVECGCEWQELLENALRAAYGVLQRTDLDGQAVDTMIEVRAVLNALEDARYA